MAYVKRITIKKTLDRSLQYITNDKKSEDGILVSGGNCASHPKVAYKQMINNKLKYEKGDKNQGYHFVQSFKQYEITDPSQAHDIGKEWANKLLEDKYQYVIATHIDKGHIHNHIIINSVNMDGKKYNANKNSLNKARAYSDDVISQYGLSVIAAKSKGVQYKEWQENKNGQSWKSVVKTDIDNAIQNANSFEVFKELMKKEGYLIKQGNVKYMTLKKEGMQRAVRGKTLGENYTEEQIIQRIALKEFNLVSEPVQRPRKYQVSSRQYSELKTYKYKRASLSNNIRLTILLMNKIRGNNSTYKNNKGKYRNKTIKDLTMQLKFVEENNIKDVAQVNQQIDKLEIKLKDTTVLFNQLYQTKDKMETIREDIRRYLDSKDKYEQYMNANMINRKILKRKYINEIRIFENSKANIISYGIEDVKGINKFIEDYKTVLEKIDTTATYIGKAKEKNNQYKKLLELVDKTGNKEKFIQYKKEVKKNSVEKIQGTER